MTLKNYKIIPNHNTSKTDLFLATEQEIEFCEKTLNIKFEDHYKDYVFTLGNGVLGGIYSGTYAGYIRIYLPNRITNTLTEWKNRITEYWFWDEGKAVLTKEEVLNSVRIGDTICGDEIIFYEKEYYILPRDSEMIYKLGKNLGKVINWLCSSGILSETFTVRKFEPLAPIYNERINLPLT